MSSCKKYNYPLLWSCESRIDVMKKETIDLFAESNCYAIQFGVESGSQYVLDTIKKNIDLAHLEEIVSYASKYAMEIFLGFMLGHYVDTIETMQDTINYIKRMLKLINMFNILFLSTRPFQERGNMNMPMKLD